MQHDTENWANVPTNSILTIHGQTVMIHPIADRYYERNPYHRRSTAYVHTKGLAANEKMPTSVNAPAPAPGTPVTEPEAPKKPVGLGLGNGPNLIPFGVGRSRTPEIGSNTSSLPRVRTPLHSSESASSSPTDVRNLTEPPIFRPQNPPAQGNIKKKRASLSVIEALHAPATTHVGGSVVGSIIHELDLHVPMTSSAPRTEYGNPNKIAQFFPELGIP
jgi:glutamine amidotransferase